MAIIYIALADRKQMTFMDYLVFFFGAFGKNLMVLKRKPCYDQSRHGKSHFYLTYLAFESCKALLHKRLQVTTERA
jgi:hypothetical protein